MKKVGIITMLGNNNCGNRLQNYALQEIIKEKGYEVYTIKNDKFLNAKKKFFKNILRYIWQNIRCINKGTKFKKFNKNIRFSHNMINIYNCKRFNKKYDYFVVGSDQIWKPTRLRMSYIDLLGFADPNKRIAYAPSFGLNSIEKKYCKSLQEELPKFKAISVREDAGKEIIKKATGITNVEVVLDPTLMIESDKWQKLEKKPEIIKKDKFIFTYFLGDEDIEKLKLKFNNSEYQFINFYKYNFGPQEFLYLIHHAELILTDSFHACAFSIIFNKNFYIFDRKQTVTNNNMNSRIDTLSRIFLLDDRRINSINSIDISKTINYNKINKILEKERKKSEEFLKKALDID